MKHVHSIVLTVEPNVCCVNLLLTPSCSWMEAGASFSYIAQAGGWQERRLPFWAQLTKPAFGKTMSLIPELGHQATLDFVGEIVTNGVGCCVHLSSEESRPFSLFVIATLSWRGYRSFCKQLSQLSGRQATKWFVAHPFFLAALAMQKIPCPGNPESYGPERFRKTWCH